MSELFNNTEQIDLLFKQYSMFVNSAEKNSDRRNHFNTFFIALHSLLISGLSLFEGFIFAYIIPICILGCALALLWLQMLSNYRRLNKAKYEIIQNIETMLPLNLYKREWELYLKNKHRLNPLRYLSFSRLEMILPYVLILIYLTLIIITYVNDV